MEYDAMVTDDTDGTLVAGADDNSDDDANDNEDDDELAVERAVDCISFVTGDACIVVGAMAKVTVMMNTSVPSNRPVKSGGCGGCGGCGDGDVLTAAVDADADADAGGVSGGRNFARQWPVVHLHLRGVLRVNEVTK